MRQGASASPEAGAVVLPGYNTSVGCTYFPSSESPFITKHPNAMVFTCPHPLSELRLKGPFGDTDTA